MIFHHRISFISNAPTLLITDNYYGDALSVYWGADTAVAAADATSLISKLCMNKNLQNPLL